MNNFDRLSMRCNREAGSQPVSGVGSRNTHVGAKRKKKMGARGVDT